MSFDFNVFFKYLKYPTSCITENQMRTAVLAAVAARLCLDSRQNVLKKAAIFCKRRTATILLVFFKV